MCHLMRHLMFALDDEEEDHEEEHLQQVQEGYHGLREEAVRTNLATHTIGQRRPSPSRGGACQSIE